MPDHFRPQVDAMGPPRSPAGSDSPLSLVIFKKDHHHHHLVSIAIKTFFFVPDVTQSVFVPDKSPQPSLMFEGACQSGVPFRVGYWSCPETLDWTVSACKGQTL